MMDTIRVPFFQNQDTFLFSKGAGQVSPLLPSCAPVSVVEYALISLNMPNSRENASVLTML